MKLQVIKSVWEELEGIIEVEDASKILETVVELTGADVSEILIYCEGDGESSMKIILYTGAEEFVEFRQV